MATLSELISDRDTAGAAYAAAAQDLADKALELKALDLAIANANVGGDSNGAFGFQALNIPPHPAYLPASPAVSGRVLDTPALTGRLEEILAAYEPS